MTGIYKKFKSGTDIRGIGIGNGDEPLYMSDEFISKASAAFGIFSAKRQAKWRISSPLPSVTIRVFRQGV